MRCEHCKQKQANIGVHVRINNQMKELHLCSDCFAAFGSKVPSPNGSFPFGHDPFQGFLKGFASSGSSSMGSHTDIESQAGRNGFLDQFGRNLSDLANRGEIDPVIGRDSEIARVIEILNRRNKNNPVLIGEPGVGKTAIAEGLALMIAQGKVPNKLQGKQVYTLDVASLVADTGIRGQFEERMKQLIAELEQYRDRILFIDEIHLLVGAGSAQGSMDAANILKPALARGDIQVIGATTLKEYRMIEKDAALERRFQPVIVNEPTVNQAIEILKGLRPKYEAYHEVNYSDEVITACVTLAHRYIQDRYLPDKAIDLLDEAGSKVNLRHGNQDTKQIQDRINKIQEEKQLATRDEQYERAAELRKEELQLLNQIEHAGHSTQTLAVTIEDIQFIIEDKTGIPVRKLQEEEQAKLKHLEERLHEKVIGQQEAVNRVAKAIRRSRAGLKRDARPIGSFLFVGPTGVGKTELAKCLAEEVFGSRDSMIRFDMSEYMEKHAVSKLIGSPPGYVGYEEAGQLTEQVRRNPYSLILLDEIEKAHPDVQHIFLQIMEDGRLTDSQGRTVSFKDTILIMTSNAGVLERKITVGFDVNEDSKSVAAKNGTVQALSSYFKPEFLNRFDSIVQFKPLCEEDLVQIVDTMLTQLVANLQEQQITLHVNQEAKHKLATMGYHPAFGARPLRRVLQQQIEDPIADMILDQPDARELKVEVADDELIVSIKEIS